MALPSGTKLGVYEVGAAIGAGGMGEVYRARDARLGRDVAIKVLPDAVASDAERIGRFEREARLLASLNHPNIAALYGMDESGSRHFLVMELVEGDTLAERLARGPLPVADALLAARQIADALEAAHERSVIHRDLKPGNIKLRPDGTVKVLDFGLAKAFDGSPLPGELTMSPTMLSPSPTLAGIILGTAAYMSPEQARGKAVDKRTDIWAFGCVLFEMLTGKQPFAGETLTDTVAAIVKNEPDVSLLPADTPRSVRTLIARCLRKDPNDRLHDIADARIEIADALGGASADAPIVAVQGSRHRERWAWASLSALLFIVAGVGMANWFRSAPAAPETRVEITTPPTADPASIAVSPDARTIAFVGTTDSVSRLLIRGLDSESSRSLMGTDGATYPFWSPDSRSLGFFADGKLKRIEVSGGPPQVLASAVTQRGGTWNRDGTILFTPQAAGPVFRVSAAGGEPKPVTRFGPQEGGSHRFPVILPDGHHFLYSWFGSPARGIYLGDTETLESHRLIESDGSAVYAAGRVFFVRQGTIFAQDFDPKRLTLGGIPSVVGEGVAIDASSLTLGALSAASDGTIIYRTGYGRGRQLVWVDRSGRMLERAGEPHDGNNPSLSPDGRRVAMQRIVKGNTDIWILELGRQLFTRFTTRETLENFPIWSPDGRYLAFGSNPKGSLDLYRKPVNGVGPDELLRPSDGNPINALDWSSDGRFILFRKSSVKTGYDLWALPLDGDRKPIPIVQTEFADREGQFSPDGKWIAYQSDESGRFEIYVQPFPGPGSRSPVSSGGGGQVRWRRDGKELFYVAFDGRLMAVPIAVSGGMLDVGVPTPLFATNIGGAIQNTLAFQYAVSANGQRFLMNTVTQEAASPITLILNWSPKR